MRHLLIAVLPLALSACAAISQHPGIVYAATDAELNQVGERLGYRVEALGMSDYAFSRGYLSFNVWAHRDFQNLNPPRSDSPLLLSYVPTRTVSLSEANAWNRDSRGMRRLTTAIAGEEGRLLRSRLLIEAGVTMQTIELYFRKFIEEISAFETHLAAGIH